MGLHGSDIQRAIIRKYARRTKSGGAARCIPEKDKVKFNRRIDAQRCADELVRMTFCLAQKPYECPHSTGIKPHWHLTKSGVKGE